MFNLTDKVALVTGATGGIGGAIAKALHDAGATVLITGRNEAKLKELEQALGDRVHMFVADLSSAESIDSLIKACVEKAERIDILVNNAGLTRDNLSMRMKEEEWKEVIDVNLTSPFLLAKAIQRSMMKNRWGRIVNITSVVGVTGNPGQANYCASKAGMIGWSKAMAAEVASRGITVNCVAPGFIATAMTEALTDDQKDKIKTTIPAGMMGTSEDIAASVLYLASSEASYVTGQTIHVNGGMAMI
jgi:3-oxoacyl-[acyl-carrier protein] reductase